jgi:hypothetical protein
VTGEAVIKRTLDVSLCDESGGQLAPVGANGIATTVTGRFACP